MAVIILGRNTLYTDVCLLSPPIHTMYLCTVVRGGGGDGGIGEGGCVCLSPSRPPLNTPQDSP